MMNERNERKGSAHPGFGLTEKPVWLPFADPADGQTSVVVESGQVSGGTGKGFAAESL